ncbi:MAG TPA: serine hydrolase domain-containing protein [Gemmatimonadaceae bacterium]|nr:serine hydrolase domain-containing protein [Gemmatimonadaceae bacterium]
MNRPIVTVLTALLAACATTAPSARTSGADASQSQRVVTAAAKTRIDSTLRAYVASGRIAGASALVWEKGGEVYFGAFGLADREANRPMTRDVIAQIFSMTKPVTGVAMMQLFEQGKFRLDDPLAKHLPEFANVRVWAGTDASGAPRLEAPSRPITVADITRHTAGFVTAGADSGLGRLFRDADPLARTNTITQFAQRLAGVPLASAPGTRWSYGISVDVQAALVERLSGQPYGEYVRQHILDPLGMRETRWFVPESDRARFAAMYRRTNGGVSRSADSVAKAYNTNRWPLVQGASGLTSTLDDYLRFARMLLNGGELDGKRILRPETVRLMATNHLPATVRDSSFLTGKGQVGFGIDFAVRHSAPKSAAEMNGAVGEFFWDGAASTLFWVDPANQLVAVLFTQVVPFDGQLHKVFRDAVYGPFTPTRR